MQPVSQRYGMIAGNGRFPLLALETARREGHEVVVVAIENEASPELASHGDVLFIGSTSANSAN